MMVWAEKAEILWTVIARVAVDVIDVQRDATSFWISFAPPANAAFGAGHFEEISTDAMGRAVKISHRAFDFARFPFSQILVVLKI